MQGDRFRVIVSRPRTGVLPAIPTVVRFSESSHQGRMPERRIAATGVYARDCIFASRIRIAFIGVGFRGTGNRTKVATYFQDRAEVAIPRRLFAMILRRIGRLCPVPI